MTSSIWRPQTLPACPCASSMKWRKSVGFGAKRQMVDIAVQGLVHSEHELSHTTSLPHAAHPRCDASLRCLGREFPDGIWMKGKSGRVVMAHRFDVTSRPPVSPFRG